MFGGIPLMFMMFLLKCSIFHRSACLDRFATSHDCREDQMYKKEPWLVRQKSSNKVVWFLDNHPRLDFEKNAIAIYSCFTCYNSTPTLHGLHLGILRTGIRMPCNLAHKESPTKQAENL